MRHIPDPARLRGYLEKFHISGLFSAPNLEFALVEFSAGEFITSPVSPSPWLLFSVAGHIRIYSISSSGSEYVVAAGDNFTLLGDVEFVTGTPPPFWAEALTTVTALALPMERVRPALEEDPKFLRFLLTSITGKLEASSLAEASCESLETRLLRLIDRTPEGTLTQIGKTAGLLHCSRRQLQRVLHECTEKGILVRIGKGTYRKTGCSADSKNMKN